MVSHGNNMEGPDVLNESSFCEVNGLVGRGKLLLFPQERDPT